MLVKELMQDVGVLDYLCQPILVMGSKMNEQFLDEVKVTNQCLVF